MKNEPQETAGANKLDLLIAEYADRKDRGENVDLDQFLGTQSDEIADAFRSYLRDVQAIDGRLDPQVLQSRDTNFSMASDETLTHPPNRPEYATGESLPRDFGRYRLLKELGRGAMGTVYLANDAELKRKVALKQPRFSVNDDQSMLERFYREAQAAATLNHPNICPVYDIGEHEGAPYITMAYVSGRTLAEVLRGSRGVGERSAASIVRKIALALAEAHRHGIIHRDLKPGNVMINERNEPIVMDFGLARQFEGAGDTRLTRDGMLVGTPAYMSPEQVECDDQRIGPQSDIYSLGVVLYEMLAGAVPFTGSVANVIAQIMRDDPPAPSAARDSVSPAMDEICLRMICKPQSGRFQTMADVAESLATILRRPIESQTETVPAEPVAAAALKAQGDQVHRWIAAGEWFKAEQLLQSMAASTEPVAANYAVWANEQLVIVRTSIQQRQQAASVTLREAQLLFNQHLFADALVLLLKIERPFQSHQTRLLLEQSVEKQKQVDQLFTQIERNLRSGRTEGTMRYLQLLMQLKPGDPVAEYLFRKFRWQSRFGSIGGKLADAFAPSGVQVTRPSHKEPFLRKYLAIAAFVLLFFCLLTAAAVTTYINRDGGFAAEVGQNSRAGEITNNAIVDVQKSDGEKVPGTSLSAAPQPVEKDSEEPIAYLGIPRTPLPDGPPGLALTLKGNNEGNMVAVSPNGKLLVVGLDKHYLWDLSTGKVVRELETVDDPILVFSYKFTPGGKELIVGGKSRIEKYDVESGRKLLSYVGPERRDGKTYPVTAIDLLPNQNRFITLSVNGSLATWDLDAPQPVHYVVVDSEPGTLVYGAYSNRGYLLKYPPPEPLKLYDPVNGNVKKAFPELKRGSFQDVSADRVLIKQALDIELFDLNTGKMTASCHSKEPITRALFTPDGRHMIASTTTVRKESSIHFGKIMIWNSATGVEVYSAEVPLAQVMSVTPDGRFLAFGQLWAVTPDGRMAFGDERDEIDPNIYLWRLPRDVWTLNNGEDPGTVSGNAPASAVVVSETATSQTPKIDVRGESP